MSIWIYDIERNAIFRIDVSPDFLNPRLGLQGEDKLRFPLFFRNVVYYKGKMYLLVTNIESKDGP